MFDFADFQDRALRRDVVSLLGADDTMGAFGLRIDKRLWDRLSHSTSPLSMVRRC